LSQQIPKTYDHKAVENRWYAEWERAGVFEAALTLTGSPTAS